MGDKQKRLQYHPIATPGFMVRGKLSRRITVASSLFDVRLHCMGEDDVEIDSFKLPADPAKLRELATALEKSATEIEGWRRWVPRS